LKEAKVVKVREREKKKNRNSLEPEVERKKQGNKFEFRGFNFDLLERSENFRESIFWVFSPNSRILPYWVFEYLVVC
jgi:hypothetical protein